MHTSRSYLDYNATAPIRPEAVEAMTEAFRTGGNPSSIHREGRAARAIVECARDHVATRLGVPREGVVFTSGGTEANNLALRGVARRGAVKTAIVAATEHPSVLQTAKASGLDVVVVGVDADGMIDLVDLERQLIRNAGHSLVSIMLANNETGSIGPVREAAALAHAHDCLMHTDAVQAVGKIAVQFDELGVDLMTISAHKFGGPVGVGALLVRDGLPIEAENVGGGQELSRRAGTENLPAIAGFGAALCAACDQLQDVEALGELRDRIESHVRSTVRGTHVMSSTVARLPNTACFASPGVTAETALIQLDLKGIAVSSGSACSSGKVARSHVLSAMGIADELAACALRVSLGWESTTEDVERFTSAWTELTDRQPVAGAAA